MVAQRFTISLDQTNEDRFFVIKKLTDYFAQIGAASVFRPHRTAQIVAG
jgi:hypothetical protein